MGDSALHPALRELQRHFSDPRVLAAMAVVALLMGFAGPFGTYELLPLAARLGYWAAIVLATYGVGYGFGVVAVPLVGRRIRTRWLRMALVSTASGIPITVAVVLVNLVTFGSDGWDVIELAELWVSVTVISLGVMLISVLVDQSLARAREHVPMPDAAGAEAGQPRVLERLPLPQRGNLVSLSVSDHYVDVVTTRGHGLVLMRLSDAIAETAPVQGLQVHRSHWVALDAVARPVRVDGKLQLELRDGRRLPVSRSYLKAVRQAGLGA